MSDLPRDSQQWLAWYDQAGASITAAMSAAQAWEAVTSAAVVTVPGASWASITRGSGADYRTMAATGEPARAADRAQYDLGHGPCLDAAGDDAVVHSGDVATDERWLDWGHAVQQLGVRSVLSVRMVTDADNLNAAINVYADAPYAFTEQSRILATMLAVHAGALVTAAARADQVENLQTALESSRAIGVAMGLLMSTHHVTRSQAFTLLRIASQTSNRKLRDIATEVADTGVFDMPVRGTTPHRRDGDA